MRYSLLVGHVISICAVIIATPVYAEKMQYQLDPTHTTVLFFVSHDGFSDMVGVVRDVSGTLQLDKENIENSQLQITLDPESIHTSSTDLDYLLQGKKFFDSKKHPFIDFTSAVIKQNTEKTARVQGNLRMHGAIASLNLSVVLNKQGKLFGTERLGFSAKGSIKRSDFAMLSYIPQVADKVRIQIETEFVKQK